MPKRHYEEAKRKGFIKTAKEMFPEMAKTAKKTMRLWGQTVMKPDPEKEYWIAGSIAPCEIVVVS